MSDTGASMYPFGVSQLSGTAIVQQGIVPTIFRENKYFSASSSGAVIGPPVVASSIYRHVNIAMESDENKLLITLPPTARWKFLARKHPIEFWSSVAALFVACFVITHAFWSPARSLTASIISSALAESRPDTPSGGVILNFITVQSFVAVLFAVILIWLFGMVTWATSEIKLSFARDNIKQLIGFFGGWVTGAAGKSI